VLYPRGLAEQKGTCRANHNQNTGYDEVSVKGEVLARRRKTEQDQGDHRQDPDGSTAR